MFYPTPDIERSVADPYHIDTDPRIQDLKNVLRSGSKPNFYKDPDPGKDDTYPDPGKIDSVPGKS